MERIDRIFLFTICLTSLFKEKKYIIVIVEITEIVHTTRKRTNPSGIMP